MVLCGLDNPLNTMKTKTITLYEYSELSPEAKEKALDKWNEYNDDPLMQSHMINLLKEELDERGIKYDTDSIDVRYSLSYCQGDGFMFLGEIDWKDYTVTIKHSGHYYHSDSKTIDMKYDTGEDVSDDEPEFAEFEAIYQEICKKMEQVGYDNIEYVTSEEYFIEACDVNEYTFREDGTMENE